MERTVRPSSEKDFAVLLDDDRSHEIIGGADRRKTLVKSSVCIQPREVVANNAVHIRKVSADEDFAIGLDRDGLDPVVEITFPPADEQVRIECRVEFSPAIRSR